MSGFTAFLPYIAAVVILLFLVKVFSLPFKLVWNGIIGGATLWLINLVGAVFAFHIEITVIKALIVGFFGVPGVVGVALWQIFA
ncbi:MAG: pro-sigmaK processing inhibitor BofA [Acholeplasmataceae bacterium]|jgi:inhibitor of the pro-sigma K processing machinery|nr:pro-sigmaK processing inhibitor BofA [Acholeplasmataceae bacterium]